LVLNLLPHFAANDKELCRVKLAILIYPLKDNHILLKAEALDDSHEARNSAAVVNELSKEITKILVSHPVNAKRAAEGKNIANVVLLRGCGIRIEVCSFSLFHN